MHASTMHVLVDVQVLIKKVIGPYSRVRIPFLARKINCDEKEVERLLASLIMDGRIDGHIDQVEQLLVLSRKCETCEVVSVNKYSQMEKIVGTLATMQKSLLQKAGGV
jgi:COP9 signalosome complex subunit 2